VAYVPQPAAPVLYAPQPIMYGEPNLMAVGRAPVAAAAAEPDAGDGTNVQNMILYLGVAEFETGRPVPVERRGRRA
jgi:hypothetical protein